MDPKNYLLKIADMDFIKKYYPHFQKVRPQKINTYIIQNDKLDIIVSDLHCKLITQNEFFDFDFYSFVINAKAQMMTPLQVLEYYIFNDKDCPLPVCKDHSIFLNEHPLFDTKFYGSFPDLIYFKSSYLIEHYINYGKKENREICANFCISI